MDSLVIGCGSIGRRHLANLQALGYHPAASDPSAESRKWVEEHLKAPTLEDSADALRQKPAFVLICTPPYLHVPLARQAIGAGAHVFIEKPLSHTLEGVDELIALARERKKLIAVGYNLRFQAGPMKLRELLVSGAIGRVLSARLFFGQYLPHWRPAQDYRKGYTAQRAMGGGIILDASHELDYARWLFGEAVQVQSVAGKVSDLEVDTEDIAEITLRMESGAIVQVHLDFVRPEYRRTCEIIGSLGLLRWDYTSASVEWLDAVTGRRETFRLQEDPNAMYRRELEHFLACIAQGRPPLVDALEGRKTLALALRARGDIP